MQLSAVYFLVEILFYNMQCKAILKRLFHLAVGIYRVCFSTLNLAAILHMSNGVGTSLHEIKLWITLMIIDNESGITIMICCNLTPLLL